MEMNTPRELVRWPHLFRLYCRSGPCLLHKGLTEPTIGPSRISCRLQVVGIETRSHGRFVSAGVHLKLQGVPRDCPQSEGISITITRVCSDCYHRRVSGGLCRSMSPSAKLEEIQIRGVSSWE